MPEASLVFAVADASQVGQVRRSSLDLVRRQGFSATEAEKVAIISTEMASNLVKHTSGGHLLIQWIEQAGETGIELLALDQGPGMYNIAECLRDGYSTAGSRGEGLGAIQRLATTFDLYSLPGVGTALLAQVWPKTPMAEKRSRIASGVINLPKPGETVCGDSWAVRWQVDQGFILMVDGLGHGPSAAMAASEAVRLFQKQPAQAAPAPTQTALFDRIHAGLRSTRGAALALVTIDFGQQVRFVGVGNIAGTVQIDQKPRHLVSHNGIVGHTVHRVQEFVYPWATGGLLILHTDGLQTRWNLEQYAGLLHRHPSLIAGVLWRDFRRGTDDVTVAVFRER